MPVVWSFIRGTVKWIQVDIQRIPLGTVVNVDVVNIGNVRSVSCIYKAVRTASPHLLLQSDLFFRNAKEQ